LDFSSALKFKHRERVSRSRIAISKRKQLALTFPDDHLFVAIDGMDNSKERFARNSKMLRGSNIHIDHFFSFSFFSENITQLNANYSENLACIDNKVVITLTK
jgi:hypothetical protein